MATFDPSDPFATVENRWPLTGPGTFGVEFFPLIKRPAFAVFALTGPAVVSVRQGGWNLELGFGHPAPNPVIDVEMRSTVVAGRKVSVQSAGGDRYALPALHLTDAGTHRSVTDQLLAAVVHRSPPWQVRRLDVDGTRREILVLDLHDDAPPAGFTGPGLLAVTQLDGTHVTIVCDHPNVPLALTTITGQDLSAAPTKAATSRSSGPRSG